MSSNDQEFRAIPSEEKQHFLFNEPESDSENESEEETKVVPVPVTLATSSNRKKGNNLLMAEFLEQQRNLFSLQKKYMKLKNVFDKEETRNRFVKLELDTKQEENKTLKQELELKTQTIKVKDEQLRITKTEFLCVQLVLAMVLLYGLYSFMRDYGMLAILLKS